MSRCEKLPDLIERKKYNNFEDFFNAICLEFQTFIVRNKFMGKTIHLARPEDNKTIRHIISKENLTSHRREVDNSRAEKITWIKHFLDTANCSKCINYHVWAKKAINNRNRWYIYCKQEKYVIILEENNEILYLITAFNVTPQKDKDFEKNYKDFLKFGCK